jgi:hypothetical protein
MFTEFAFPRELTEPLGLQQGTAIAGIPSGLRENPKKPRTVKLTYEKWDYGRHPLSAPPDNVDRVVAANQSGGFGNAVSSVYDYFFEVARAIFPLVTGSTSSHASTMCWSMMGNLSSLRIRLPPSGNCPMRTGTSS